MYWYIGDQGKVMKDEEGIKKAEKINKDSHHEIECRCKESKNISVKELG